MARKMTALTVAAALVLVRAAGRLHAASWRVCCKVALASRESAPLLEGDAPRLGGPCSQADRNVSSAEGAPTESKDVAVAEGALGAVRPWPEECDATLRYVFAGSSDVEAQLQRACQHFERLVGEDDHVTSSTLSTADGVEQVLVQLLQQVIGVLPLLRMSWMQFLVLSTMHALCSKHYKPSSSARGTAFDCVDIVALHARRLLAGYDSSHSWSDQRIAASLFPGQWLGEFIFAAPDNFTLANAVTERQDELWTRFVRRVPEYASSNSTLDQEEQFGTAGLRAAESLVAVLLEEPDVEDLLAKLGELRREIDEQGGAERGGQEMGARRLRYGSLRMASMTVNSGNYIPAWRRRLFEAVTDDSRAADVPLGPFATPNSSDVIWARHCGAVLTWVDVPWEYCAPIINSHPRAGFAVGGFVRDWMGDGISNAGRLCRILMNRAVLRPTLDGALLGEDCKDRFGWAFDDDVGESWKMFPLTYHASPLAQELVEKIIVKQLLTSYYRAAAQLGVAEGEMKRRSLLEEIGHSVASIFYFLSNIKPYIRGSPTAIAVLHHALWMRLGAEGGQASPSRGRSVLRCLGLWRNGSFPPTDDCYAVRSNGTWFTHHLYSVLLDHPKVRSPEQLFDCVSAALPVGGCLRAQGLEGEVGDACLLEGPEAAEGA